MSEEKSIYMTFYEKVVEGNAVTVVYRDTMNTVGALSAIKYAQFTTLFLAWLFQALDNILGDNDVNFSQGYRDGIVLSESDIGIDSYRGFYILRHEMAHVFVSRKHPILFALGYILPPSINPFRTLIELHGYTYSMQANYEEHGHVDEKFVEYIVDNLSSVTYLWSWPFKGHLRKYVKRCRAKVQNGEIATSIDDEYLGLWEFWKLIRD